MKEPVSIQSADERAFAAILEHHAALRQEVDQRVQALRAAVATSVSHQPALTDLTAFLVDSVLPHARAEEATLYPAAAEPGAAPGLVDAMVADHRALVARTRGLAGADSALAALAAAEGIAAIFALHVDKENELLLPAIMRSAGPSLASLLEGMHQHLERPAPAEPAPTTLDVRTLPRGRRRHELVFDLLARLPAGGRLIITNDHDPRPLRYQVDGTWPETFGWEYLESGPRVWRVEITRRT